MFLDLKPLFRYRDYRFLYFGQLVSFFGSMITYVALPYQLFHLTGSSLAVGMVGVVQLVPLLFTALVGGAFADAMDRRRLLIAAEFALGLCSLVLVLNARSEHPSVALIYIVAGVASGMNGFHRPANNAMVPRLVAREDIPAASALDSFRRTVAQVGGPALGGILIAVCGLSFTYFIDVLSFAFSLAMLSRMKPMPPAKRPEGERPRPTLSSIVEGLKYAGSRQELIGTYVVDIVAMVFGMPMALFPAIAEGFGGAKVVGWLYSAPSAGALIATLMSAWTGKVHRHGAAVIWAAAIWGVAITVFGLSTNLWLSLILLAIAGGADMISAIFRSTIWNGTVPDHLRGRLSGVEMLSYMSGPLLGNAESGLVAAAAGTRFSVVSGGILCVVGVAACAWRLPQFWHYDERRFTR